MLGSTLSFVFVNIHMFRQPGQEKTWTVPFLETGIALCLLALALFVAAHLARLGCRETPASGSPRP